jgi:hypothetical protein
MHVYSNCEKANLKFFFQIFVMGLSIKKFDAQTYTQNQIPKKLETQIQIPNFRL